MMEDLSMETMEAEPQPARPRASFNLFNLLAVLFLALSCLSALCIGTALVVPGVVPEAFRPGPIIDLRGVVVGEHEGLAAYTVGNAANAASGLILGAERVYE